VATIGCSLRSSKNDDDICYDRNMPIGRRVAGRLTTIAVGITLCVSLVSCASSTRLEASLRFPQRKRALYDVAYVLYIGESFTVAAELVNGSNSIFPITSDSGQHENSTNASDLTIKCVSLSGNAHCDVSGHRVTPRSPGIFQVTASSNEASNEETWQVTVRDR
jgi:hypothetical protein